MGRRQKLRGGDEWDIVNGWRRIYCSYQRAGRTAAIKRRMRRRARREGKLEL